VLKYTTMDKPRIVKDYDKLDTEIQEQLKLNYPKGFEKSLITIKNVKNAFVSVLPFETDDKYYLVRMTKTEAQEIVEEDEDYDDDGNLIDEVRDEYEERYEE